MSNVIIIAGIEFVAGSYKKVSNRSGLAFWSVAFDADGIAEFTYTNRRMESRSASLAECEKLVSNGYVTSRTATAVVADEFAETDGYDLSRYSEAPEFAMVTGERTEFTDSDAIDYDAIAAENAAGIN